MNRPIKKAKRAKLAKNAVQVLRTINGSEGEFLRPGEMRMADHLAALGYARKLKTPGRFRITAKGRAALEAVAKPNPYGDVGGW